MTTTLEMPPLAVRMAEALTVEMEEMGARPEESPRDPVLVAEALRLVGGVFRRLQAELERRLGEGIEGGLRRVVPPLLRLTRSLEDTLQKRLKDEHPTNPPRDAPLDAALAATLEDTSSLRRALEPLEDIVSASPPLFDVERARAAEEAFERGETRPFRKGLLTGK